MSKELTFIFNCKSWSECNQQIAKLTTGKQAKLGGNIFEHVVKLYLQTEPKYQTKFKQVWLLDEVPHKVKQLLRLPQADEGIDLVVKTNDDEYWSVQAKYRSNIDETLVFAGKGGLSTFQSLSFVTCKNISHGLICATVNKPPVKKYLLKNIGFEVADTWLSLDENNCAGWKRIQAKAKGKKLIVKPATPRPHQRNAIKEAKKHFLTSKNTRGKMIMPCGTGKSLASFWIANELKAKNIIVAVPSIALIKQTLNTWATESILNKRKIDWLCVCSDESVDNDQDEIISNTSDLGIKPTTNQKEIEKFLKHKTKNLKVIFTTYQSGTVTAKAARKIKISFDLGLFDEAHKTVGHKDKKMAHLIFEKNIKIKKRLFMTATERLFRLNSTEYLSMDNKDNYGEIFYQLSFKKAIDSKPPIISDYKVITIGIDEEEIKTLVQKNKFLRLRKKIDNITARELAVGIALRKAIKKYNIKNTLTFHSSIKRANNFSSQQEIISKLYPKFGKFDSFHVHGGMNASERSLLLKEFGNSSKSLMTNARCLTEGIDLPSIDCVCFTDPKKSKTDIVQAAGRALRISKSKKFGYILIPVNITKNKNSEIVSNDNRFNEIISIVGALSSQDTRIAEYLRSISMGHKPKGSNPIDGINKIISYTNIDKNYFEENIKIKIWNKIASFNYRNFHDAKNFVRSLKLKNGSAWFSYAKTKAKPKDIPAAASAFYKDKGWISMGDWLGTGFVATRDRVHRDFDKARSFVREKNLESGKEWKSFTESEDFPNDIPINPWSVYNEYLSMGDWLGTGRVQSQKIKFRKFSLARKFARSLKFKNQDDWQEFAKTEKRPTDIPADPSRHYKYKGWISWGDWLGTGYKKNIEYRNFDKARNYAHSLKLEKREEWENLNNLPEDIPKAPSNQYPDDWIGWGDWLGTNIVSPQERSKQFTTFKKARSFVRTLGLKNELEWRKFKKTDKMPIYIPSDPGQHYKNKGWKGMGDWLGTGNVHKKKFRSFKDARLYAHSLNIESSVAWIAFAKTTKKPKDIPANPSVTYKDKGWKGWAGFLGKTK